MGKGFFQEVKVAAIERDSKYKIADSKWLTDEQVSMLLESMLRTQPDIDFYDAAAVTQDNKFHVPEGGHKAVISTGANGTTVQNVGDKVKSIYEHITGQIANKHSLGEVSLEAKDIHFVVPVNVGVPIINSEAAKTAMDKERGSHWVLAVLSPDLDRKHDAGQIPYKMNFVDSMHNSKGGTEKSDWGKRIFGAMQSAGLAVGDNFNDLSCRQQKDGWSCGYLVAENAVARMSGQPLNTEPVTDIFIQNATKAFNEEKQKAIAEVRGGVRSALAAPPSTASADKSAPKTTPTVSQEAATTVESGTGAGAGADEAKRAEEVKAAKARAEAVKRAEEEKAAKERLEAEAEAKARQEEETKAAKAKAEAKATKTAPPLATASRSGEGAGGDGGSDKADGVGSGYVSTGGASPASSVAGDAPEPKEGQEALNQKLKQAFYEVTAIKEVVGDLSKLFGAQRKAIEDLVAEATAQGAAFKLVGEPERDDATGVTKYTYVHPEAYARELQKVAANEGYVPQYSKDECITYHVDGDKTTVEYGKSVKNALVFAMPDESKKIGAKAVLTVNGVHQSFGDERNNSVTVAGHGRVTERKAAVTMVRRLDSGFGLRPDDTPGSRKGGRRL